MTIIVDTQIVSYIFKGSSIFGGDLAGLSVASTVAHEFLCVRDVATGEARYFTPPPTALSPAARESYLAQRKIHGDRPSDRPLFKRATDKIIMDFNNEFPSIVEYGHLGISYLLASANRVTFGEAVNHLSKRERKNLVGRFEFLADQRVECLPITGDCIPIAFGLLKRMTARGFNLKSDFRNSLNDMLILGAAITRGADLWTQDELLAQFAAEVLTSKVKQHDTHYEIPLKPAAEIARRVSRESKGYINTGWRYAVR